ncbi:hypothetical protein P7K49_009709, partial [Saguinus oedipus]
GSVELAGGEVQVIAVPAPAILALLSQSSSAVCQVQLTLLTKKGKECVSPAPFSELSGCSMMGGVHGVSWIHRKQENVIDTFSPAILDSLPQENNLERQLVRVCKTQLRKLKNRKIWRQESSLFTLLCSFVGCLRSSHCRWETNCMQ